MALKVDDPRDIQGAYEQGFATPTSLKEAEQGRPDDYLTPSSEQSESVDPVENARQQESTSNLSQYANSYTKNNQKTRDWKASLKKTSPGIVIALLLGLASIASFFGFSGMAIVNFVEQYTNRFNTQLSSMDASMSRIMKAKLNNTTRGMGCKVGASIYCKYSTFSEKQIEDFKKNKLAPLDVEKTITGRYKISGFKKETGEIVKANDFAKQMKSDLDFRANITRSYGGVGGLKYAGLWDNIAKKVKGKFHISFSRPFKKDATDEDRKQVIDERSKGKSQEQIDATDTCKSSDSCTKEEAEESSKKAKAAEEANSRVKGAEKFSSTEESAAAKIGKGAASTGALVKGMGALGIADTACQFIGFSRAVGYVMRTTRLNQFIQFSQIFLTTHSMIKVGDASPDDVSFVGNMLMQSFRYPDGSVSKTATESFGYRNAAYGDTGIDEAASPFVLGASFGGVAAGVMQKVIQAITKVGDGANSVEAIRKVCGFVNNKLVVAGSMIAGFAMMLLPGVNAVTIAKQAAFQISVIAAQSILLAKVADVSKGIIIGKNDPSEGIGNIMNVSTSSLLGSVGNHGGNPLVKRGRLGAVLASNEETKLAYAAMERLDKSPLDISSSSTFLGSIYASLTPYILNQQTPLSTLSSLANISLGSFSRIMPRNAALAADAPKCEEEDPDIKDAGFATTEFCVPWTGTDPQYFNTDPLDTAEFLVSKGYLDGDNDEFTEKAKPFIENCVERNYLEKPYGYTGENFDEESGKNCLINDSNVAHFSPTGNVNIRLAKNGSGGNDSGDMTKLENVSDDAKVAIYNHIQDQRNNDILDNGLPKSDTQDVSASTGGEIQPPSGKMVSPIPANMQGKVLMTSKYRYYKSGGAHWGVDLASGVSGSWSFVSACDGTVHSIHTPAGTENSPRSGSGTTNYVWIKCDNGIYMGYAHWFLKDLKSYIKVGAKIGAGTEIAPQGNQGNARGGPPGNGAHLHFQINKSDPTSGNWYSESATVDPAAYLKAAGVQLPSPDY